MNALKIRKEQKVREFRGISKNKNLKVNLVETILQRSVRQEKKEKGRSLVRLFKINLVVELLAFLAPSRSTSLAELVPQRVCHVQADPFCKGLGPGTGFESPALTF